MSVRWVNASKSPFIPGTRVHAVSLTPLVFMLVYFSWLTFFLTLSVVTFMSVLSMKGRTLTWLLRKMRGRLRGFEVQARPFWYLRRFNRLESVDLHGVHLGGESAKSVDLSKSGSGVR